MQAVSQTMTFYVKGEAIVGAILQFQQSLKCKIVIMLQDISIQELRLSGEQQ